MDLAYLSTWSFLTYQLINNYTLGLSLISLILMLVSVCFLFKWKLTISLIIQFIALILYIIKVISIHLIDWNTSLYYLTGYGFFGHLALLGLTINFLYLLYFKVKLGFSEELKIFEKSKLEKIMRVSEKIDLEIMRNILEMDQKDFQEKIIDISQKNGMRIEGSNLIIDKERLDDFLNSLEQKFKEWEES